MQQKKDYIRKADDKTDANNKMELTDLMLQYSIVTKTYLNKEGKLVAYVWLTDGFVHVPLSKQQREQFIRTATDQPRYEVGVEQYFEPTGDSLIDGYDPEEELQLRTVLFHHIFIRAEHYGEVFEKYRDDRKITFLKKGEAALAKQKEATWQKQNGEQITTHP